MSQQFPFNQFLKIEKTSPNYEAEQPSQKTKQETHLSSPKKDDQKENELISKEILKSIKTIISPTQYSAYFAHSFNLTQIGLDKIEFTVPTSFIKNMLENEFIQTISHSVQTVLGRFYKIEIKVILEGNYSDMPQKKKAITKSNVSKNTFVLDEISPTKDDLLKAVDSQIIEHLEARPTNGFVDPKKIFDNFIVGPSNNLAHASSLAVAKNPGRIYPNLFIFGNSGLGKTHLIYAISNYIQETKPNYRVNITSCNNFMSRYVEAVKTNKVMEFRRDFIELSDVLIIDDIHEIGGKPGTQDQFFHIVNELSSRKKQLIFTSDKNPSEMNDIEDRVKTRLSSSLAVEVYQPDFETRIAILKEKSQEKDIYLTEDVVNHIAKCVQTNVRDLEGCLIRLGAYSSLMNVDIDLEIAVEQLKLKDVVKKKELSQEYIISKVARHYNVAVGDIIGKSKTKEIATARQMAMYLIHSVMKPTLSDIASQFNKKDHTTVLYGIRQVQNKLKNNPQFADEVIRIQDSL